MNKPVIYVAERNSKDGLESERGEKLKNLLMEKGFIHAYVLGYDPKSDSMSAHAECQVVLLDARGLEKETKCDIVTLLVDMAVIWKKQIMLYDSVEDEEQFTDFNIDFDAINIPKEQRVIYKDFETAVSHISSRINRSKKKKDKTDV